MTTSTQRHHFTVDVEEFFHASAMARAAPMEQWASLPRRSPRLVADLLHAMDEAGVEGTFFVLGWLAEREPAMIRSIAEAGHEIASHTWDHRLVTSQRPEEFRDSVRRAKRFLEDLTGQPVVGFRAPSFSIVPGCEWAFDVLLEEGYAYDSSLFPVAVHPTYGYPTPSRDPYWIDRPAGRLLELPMSTVRIAGRDLPASGGAYFRFFPLTLVRTALRHAARRGAPGVFYIHPWELDGDMGRLPVPFLTNVRMTWGTGSAPARLGRLWRRHRFGPMRDALEAMSGGRRVGPRE